MGRQNLGLGSIFTKTVKTCQSGKWCLLSTSSEPEFQDGFVIHATRYDFTRMLVSVRTGVDLRRRNERNNELYELKVDVGMLNTAKIY